MTKELQASSGLYDYGFRFYSPGLGRWINRDPIKEDGGLNLYGFVANDPVNLVDLHGKSIVSTMPVFGGLGAAAAAAAAAAQAAAEAAAAALAAATMPVWGPPAAVVVGGGVTAGVVYRYVGVPLADRLYPPDYQPELPPFLPFPPVTSKPWVCPATDSSKNEKHGDSGRTLSKVEEQLEKLRNELANATGREATKIAQKIKNITKIAKKAESGTEDTRRGKRN